MNLKAIKLLTASILMSANIHAQSLDVTDSAFSISERTFRRLEKFYANMNKSIEKQTEKMLKRVEKQEQKIKKEAKGQGVKVQETQKTIQSARIPIQSTVTSVQSDYDKLLTKLKAPTDNKALQPLQEYVPGLDSIKTALHLLGQETGSKVQGLNTQLLSLEKNLQIANEANILIKQRVTDLQKLATGDRQLATIKKQSYYYNERVKQYKETLNDKNKLKDEILKQVSKTQAYASFMQRYGYWASLFGAKTPQNYGTPQALAGLQTRASVEALITQRGGPNLAQAPGNTQSLDQLKQHLNDKLQQATGLQQGDLNMPDFKPNTQKTKTFWKRLEPACDIQSQRKNGWLPAISDIGLSLGYKLNDKSTIGIGASYKLGWGAPLKNIRFSGEGYGVRSFLDWKAVGKSKSILLSNLFISGGGELNYLSSIANNDANLKPDTWQRSALIGLTKKTGRAKTQLLYDFLWKKGNAGSALKFRVGFSL